jgi:bifunctional non-homologous end joining protein LigD
MTTTKGVDNGKTAGVAITHPERVVYQDMGLTKLDLAEYYALVAPLMLPHIKGRPISSVRCPDGQGGECFFQKHWPPRGGAAVLTKLVQEGESEPKPYAFANSARDIVALVQNGVMETHVWGSRIDSLEKPDRIVLDLDPGPGITWLVIKKSAIEVRALLDSIGLKSWVKLTGGKGVHIVVPVDRRVTWPVLSSFAKTLAERLMRDAPNLYVAKASKAIRDKRIFIDWLRNTRGATSAAPWSPRAREGAPVSLPLHWDELASVRKPNQYSIPIVTKMVATSGDDPWADMLTYKQRLTAEMAEELLGA